MSLVSLRFREKGTVRKAVVYLSEGLRHCHRKPIEWLEPTISQHTEWITYGHEYLVSPILQLFRGLRPREVKDDIVSHAIQEEGGILKIWFTSLDFDKRADPVHPPTIFITPQPFHDLVSIESIMTAVSPILGHVASNSIAKTIFTDLKTVIIMHPAAEESKQVREIEVLHLKDDLRAFRILVAAYLLKSMPRGVYMNPPAQPPGKYTAWLPPRRYDDADTLLDDEQVFLTKHRYSDFDITRLIEDREAALQFFRWKLFVQKHVATNITSAGDILECTTHEFDRRHHPPRGICSKPMSASTLQHMESILRPNPLNPMVLSALNSSRRFTIKLGRALGRPDLKHVFTRLHLCCIESIDGRPVENCPELVMKVFDDRFMELLHDPPYDEDGVNDVILDMEPHEWFETIFTAEWHVRGELTAFEKMHIAQGSLIPYFYGAHQFRLANGHELFGVLMEYVDAPTMASGVMKSCTEEQRGQMMTSIRHALRVLQRSDIAQHDWHAGQILCNFSHSTPHAVFIDFSATSQAIDVDIDEEGDNTKDDYGHCIAVVSRENLTGVDMKWVAKYWERDEMKRESWDVYGVTVCSVVTRFAWESHPVDPYKFVYEKTK